MDTCERDGERESYLTPRDHSPSASDCRDRARKMRSGWSFDDGQGPVKRNSAPCDQEIKLRVAYGKTTVATVDVPLGDGTAQRIVTEIAVRDVLIAGLGDSIAAAKASGPGGKARSGFCFKRFLNGATGQYFRPSRAAIRATAPARPDVEPERGQDWARHGARWMNPGCHARCTAIKCAPRWRWRSSRSTSP